MTIYRVDTTFTGLRIEAEGSKSIVKIAVEVAAPRLQVPVLPTSHLPSPAPRDDFRFNMPDHLFL